MNSERCRNTALRYVAMRMRTEGQVADYLRRKEFEEADIADAIGFLREYRYVDDVRYCRMYFREACLKGRGRRRIEQELMRRKVDRSIIRESIDSYLSEDNEEYQQLLEEIMTEKDRALSEGRKMLKNHEESGRYADKNFLAKVGRRLMGLGYGSETIYSVIGTLMKERKEEDDKR